MKGEKISIIIPACNEEKNLIPLMQRIDAALKANSLEGEVIIVDDGSRDGTWQALQRLVQAYPFLRPLRHEENLGITASLNTATAEAKHETLVFLPSDLQSDPIEDLPKLLAKMKEGDYDVVVGRRDVWNRPLGKVIESKIYSFILRHFFGVRISDFNWVRAFKKKTAQSLHLRKDWHRYFVVLCASRGSRIGEVGVKEYPRQKGKSKFNFFRVISGFLDLFVIWFYLKFTQKPMNFFGTLGVASSAAGSLLLLFMAYLYLVHSPEATTRPLFFLMTILIIVGFQSFVFGLLAELVITKSEEASMQTCQSGEEKKGQ